MKRLPCPLILGPQARSLQVRALKYDVWFWTTRSWPAELVFDLETISAARPYPVDSRLPKYQADHMSTYYFVAFESRSKPDALVKTVSNVILKDLHPVFWLANPPDAYREYWVGYLLFWSEISENVALEGARYTPIEGPDETFSVREGMAKAFDLV